MNSIQALTLALALAAGALVAQVRPAPAVESGAANLPLEQIGANDLIAVSVYDAPELTRTVRVGADGYLRLPLAEERILAEGLMPAELETRIAAVLQKERLIVDPFVTVTVAEYCSRPISVMGAVRRPLTFQALGPVTLLEALARAEGLSPEAGAEIIVTRSRADTAAPASGLLQRVPVKGLLSGTAPGLNVLLKGGEEIRVAEAGKLFVVGNVKKPGAFAVREDAEPTVLKALALAEGLQPYTGKIAYIYRRDAAGSKHEIPVELARIMSRKSPDIPLGADDVLYVPDASGRRAGMAALEKALAFATGASIALIYTGR